MLLEWYVFALGCAVLASAAAITEKRTLMKEHAMEFSAVLALVNALFLLPVAAVSIFSIPLDLLVLTYIASILASVAFLYVAKSLRHMEISAASPLLNFGPAFTALVAFMVLGENLSSLQLFGIALIILGSYVLEVDHKLHDLAEPFRRLARSKYIHFIFIALILYSVSSVIDKIVLSSVSPIVYLSVAHLFMAVNFVVMITAFHNGIEGIRHGVKNAWKWIVVVAMFTTGYRLLQLQAVSMVMVSMVIPIKRLSTLFSTVIGGGLFHEEGLLVKSAACAVMLAGVWLVITG